MSTHVPPIAALKPTAQLKYTGTSAARCVVVVSGMPTVASAVVRGTTTSLHPAGWAGPICPRS
jgi:hypothetical protein